MAKAFEAYKVRWAREEEAMKRLIEKKVELRRYWDYHRSHNWELLPEEEVNKLKDDVRLFRVREDAIKDEFKSTRDKPLTDEETEQMWRNDCPPRGGSDSSQFEERHGARNSRMDEWRARNAEMNEQFKQMRREVEEEEDKAQEQKVEAHQGSKEDRARAAKGVGVERKVEADRGSREQDIEEDKGRSTKNITEEYEKMWNSSKASGGGAKENTWDPVNDPLAEDLHKTGKAGKDFFDEGKRVYQENKRTTEEQIEAIKKNWNDSSFFSDNSGSSGTGGFRSHPFGVGRPMIAFVFITFIVVFVLNLSNRNDMYSTNLYLQELEKLEKLKLEPTRKKEDVKIPDQ